MARIDAGTIAKVRGSRRTASNLTPQVCAKVVMDWAKKNRRLYGIDRLYESAKDHIHFDAFGGGFGFGFEQDGNKVYADGFATGEAIDEVDDAYYRVIRRQYRTTQQLLKALNKMGDDWSDAMAEHEDRRASVLRIAARVVTEEMTRTASNEEHLELYNDLDHIFHRLAYKIEEMMYASGKSDPSRYVEGIIDLIFSVRKTITKSIDMTRRHKGLNNSQSVSSMISALRKIMTEMGKIAKQIRKIDQDGNYDEALGVSRDVKDVWRMADKVSEGLEGHYLSPKRHASIRTAATNSQVVKMFMDNSFPRNKRPVWGTPRLKITRFTPRQWGLVNYSTPLLAWVDQKPGKLFFNQERYSKTTGTIQNYIKRLAQEMGVKLWRVSEDKMRALLGPNAEKEEGEGS